LVKVEALGLVSDAAMVGSTNCDLGAAGKEKDPIVFDVAEN
jgi:hypothetical protein